MAAVQVDLAAGRAVVAGEGLDVDELIAAVGSAGYRAQRRRFRFDRCAHSALGCEISARGRLCYKRSPLFLHHARTLSENIDWVGAVDWAIRDFHSYDTERGTTYNAYLVRDEKTALIDTVKSAVCRRIAAKRGLARRPASVDYVVCNHAELDHSGALPEVIRAMPQATLLCDKKCAATLGEHFDTSAWKIRVVASGETISLGRRRCSSSRRRWSIGRSRCSPTCRRSELLFSMDAFGQHYATSERFDDEADLPSVMREAKTYYANIVLPFGKSVLACLERIAGLKIDMIAPSHGLIWRRHGIGDRQRLSRLGQPPARSPRCW